MEQHQAFINDKPTYAQFFELIDKGAERLEYLYHAKFSVDVTPALDAPTTEIASWTLHPGTDSESFDKQAATLMEMLYKELPEEILGGNYTRVIEDKPNFTVLLGWHSLEVSMRYTSYSYDQSHVSPPPQRFLARIYGEQGNKELLNLITAMKTGADLDLKHVKLSRYY